MNTPPDAPTMTDEEHDALVEKFAHLRN